MARVLILGGTGDAAAIAAQAATLPHLDVITSLAGRTSQPAAVAGTVRVGGFGGVAGLVAYLREQQIDYIVDATHPFAAQMSWHAAAAALEVGIPHLMLVRPAWTPLPDDRWLNVDTVEAAAIALPPTPSRVFLTIGRQQLEPFVPLTQHWFLVRSIDPPAIAFPNSTVLCDRGPFGLEQERQLLQTHRIEWIVSKNSGGDATYAKVVAARELGIPILMVQRPARPAGEQVSDVASAVAWLMGRSLTLSSLQQTPVSHRITDG